MNKDLIAAGEARKYKRKEGDDGALSNVKRIIDTTPQIQVEYSTKNI